MKIEIKTRVFGAMLLLFTFLGGSISAQDKKENTIENLIGSKNFVFKAQSVSPMRGSMRNLTSDYDLRILGDSIVSYLPYFGRAYTAPMGSESAGIQFTTTVFTYTAKKKKKGWDITILPKEANDVRQLFLSVSNSGYARLQVLSNNRDQISFNGVIQERKQ